MVELSANLHQQFVNTMCNPMFKELAVCIVKQVKEQTGLEPAVFGVDGEILDVTWKTQHVKLLCTLEEEFFVIRKVKDSMICFYDHALHDQANIVNQLVSIISSD